MTTFTLKEKQRRFLEFVKDLDEVIEDDGVYNDNYGYLISRDELLDIIQKGEYRYTAKRILNRLRKIYENEFVKKNHRKNN